MKGYIEVENLFFSFPNQWFTMATICRVGGVTGTHAREMLRMMEKLDVIKKKRIMKKHRQAFFYQLSASNRKRALLQNRA